MLRRSHRKSRLGCKNCKSRRMKCDEVHPHCANCVKHKIVCDFSSVERPLPIQSLPPVKIPSLRKHTSGVVSDPRSCARTETISSSSSNMSGTSSPAKPFTTVASGSMKAPAPLPNFAVALEAFLSLRPPLQPAVGTPADGYLDRRLFHHYVQTTSTKVVRARASQWGPVVDQQHVWAKWIITLAFSHQPLMDAVLGFSAFHLRSLNPSDRELILASHKYMSKALRGHADEVRNGVHAGNAEAVFATSTIVASHACLSQKHLNEDIGPPVHWFKAYRGVKAVLETGWEWIQNSKIRYLLANEVEFINTVVDFSASPSESVFGFLLKDLETESLDTATIECYRSAVAILDWINNYGSPRHVLRFSAMMPPRFVELLSEHDPRVLTIVGYFFMTLKRIESIWWLEGTVESEFWALLKILPQEWWPQMDWAVREFQGGELVPSDST